MRTPWAVWRSRPTIRLRLGAALAAALIPVLVLSSIQSGLTFQHESNVRRAELVAAARRSAAAARARIQASGVLLETLAPRALGFQCAQRLAEVASRVPGYLNLIRFDSLGRIACSAGSVPADPGRRGRVWFQALAQGAPIALSSSPGANYGPALLAGVRAEDDAGRFDGVVAAVISLASLRPEPGGDLPSDSEVALVDPSGRILSATAPRAFPPVVPPRLVAAQGRYGFGFDQAGKPRVFSSAPLVGRDIYVLLSAPSPGIAAWAWVNRVSAIAIPLLGFLLALAAVWIVAERGVVRWIAYLQRIAAIYARGRFTVHPVKAIRAPPEISDLAETLDAMAETIAARDAALTDSLAEKDQLMREIHHRVKNNLQVITSLLNMQQRSMGDPAAQAAMNDTRQRITALALIYRALYEGPDLKRVDLRDFLDELIGQLVAGSGDKAPVHTTLAIDPLVIDPDRLAPLALFAVEAITNARKHGLAAKGGELSVVFKVRGEAAELSISDSGAQGAAAPDVTSGVGRTLMAAFARQLRGEVLFCRNSSGGLTARLTFPTPALDEA